MKCEAKSLEKQCSKKKRLGSKGPKSRKTFSLTLTDDRVLAILRDAAVATYIDKLITPEHYFQLMDVIARRDIVSLLTKVIPSLECAVASLRTLEEVRAHLALVSIVKKFPFANGVDDENRESTAYDTWLSCEASCLNTNRKFILAKERGDYSTFDPRTLRVIARARTLMRECVNSLGNIDNAVMYSIRNGRFGPGMSLCSENNRDTSSYYKMEQLSYSCTKTCQPYFMAAISYNQRWLRYLIRRDRKNPKKGLYSGAALEYSYLKRAMLDVSAARLSFVDKNALTKRSISIGGLGNIYVQLGYESWLRKCIKHYFHLDISDTSMNRYLAWAGSTGQPIATVDSRSASDMIATEVIRFLSDELHFAFMYDLREHEISYKGRIHQLEKFSGMGNGYTFALESLVFIALTKASQEECGDEVPFAVHGDDIACGTATAEVLATVFPDIGFIINVDKTYTDGPFREACGYDFWNGHNVRQYYLTESVLTEPTLISLYNGIQTTAYRNGLDADCKPWLMGVGLEELILKLDKPYVGQATDGNLYSNATFGESRYLVAPASPSAYGFTQQIYSVDSKPIKWNRDADYHLRWLHTLQSGMTYNVTKRGLSRIATRRQPMKYWLTSTIKYSPAVVTANEYFILSILIHKSMKHDSVHKGRRKSTKVT